MRWKKVYLGTISLLCGSCKSHGRTRRVIGQEGKPEKRNIWRSDGRKEAAEDTWERRKGGPQTSLLQKPNSVRVSKHSLYIDVQDQIMAEELVSHSNSHAGKN